MSNDSTQGLDNETTISQWVSSILNVETKSEKSLSYLNSVLGPVKNDLSVYKSDDSKNESLMNTLVEELSSHDLPSDNFQSDSQGSFKHEIIFKIDEKVFIDKINIYEKVSPGSSLVKIEALEKTNPDIWFNQWESLEPIEENKKPKIFAPDVKPTPFKTDTIRLTICGSLYLIDGIEIIGNKIAIEPKKKQEHHISMLSRHLKGLVLNDLFADVYFEVEGKIIPAHRNILVCRSEYFRAMLSTHGHFKESVVSTDPSTNPIYVKDIEYKIFLEILNYLYTGHISSLDIPFSVLIGIMRAADRMNLVQLEKLCLFHLSDNINRDNVIKIYKEASETPDVLKQVIQMCYDEISNIFKYISRTEDFCSLPQDLMLKIIENVVPKLNRLTSSQLNGENQNEQADQQLSNNLNELNVNQEFTDTEDESD